MLVARVNRSCNFGTSITKPNIARMQAPTIRNVSGSSPSEAPKVARKIPTIAKESASPIPSATAPQRCAFTAEATSTGIRGKTQGDSVDNAPASSPRPYVGSPKFIIAAFVSGHGAAQKGGEAVLLRISRGACAFLAVLEYHDGALLRDPK